MVKWLSLIICLSVRGMLVTKESRLYLFRRDGPNRDLSLIVKDSIVLTINTNSTVQY